jgi:hypothetical protein
MPPNIDALQVVIGAALLDTRYRAMLLADRREALDALATQPCAPAVQLSPEERDALLAIPAASLAELAGGVRRLRGAAQAGGYGEAQRGREETS